MLRKLTSLLLIMLMIFSTATLADANTFLENLNVETNQKIVNVITQLDSAKELSSVKKVHDFDGNEYTVVECAPEGYLIYNTETQIIMEYSLEGQSPYHNCEGDLRYCGPSRYYYAAPNQEYKHTILGYELSSEAVLTAKDISKNAQRVFATANTKTDNAACMRMDNPNSIQATTTYIGNNKSFFTNLNTKNKIGYYVPDNTNGICGYIASGIVLLYYDYCLNKNYINNDFLNSAGNAFKDTSFTRHLYEDIGVSGLGYSSATNASQIAQIMKTYLSVDKGISVTTWVGWMPSVSDIIYQLQNRQIPVVYVDRFYDPRKTDNSTVDHDIVVYGYDTNNNLHTHFGWVGSQYTDVVCSSPASAAFVSSACAITYY